MHGFWLWLICVLVQRRPAGRRGGQAWLRARALRRAGQVTNRALGDTTLKHAIRRHAQVGRCAKAGEGLAPARPITTAAKIVPEQERGPGAGLACRVLPVLQYIISFTCSSDFLARHPTQILLVEKKTQASVHSHADLLIFLIAALSFLYTSSLRSLAPAVEPAVVL